MSLHLSPTHVTILWFPSSQAHPVKRLSLLHRFHSSCHHPWCMHDCWLTTNSTSPHLNLFDIYLCVNYRVVTLRIDRKLPFSVVQMSQREIIEKIAAYSSVNSTRTEEDFYKLQSLLSNGDVKAIVRTPPTEAKDIASSKQTADYDSNQIASLFSEELRQLREDPEFTGTSGQVEYLKDILSADKLVAKLAHWIVQDSPKSQWVPQHHRKGPSMEHLDMSLSYHVLHDKREYWVVFILTNSCSRVNHVVICKLPYYLKMLDPPFSATFGALFWTKLVSAWQLVVSCWFLAFMTIVWWKRSWKWLC